MAFPPFYLKRPTGPKEEKKGELSLLLLSPCALQREKETERSDAKEAHFLVPGGCVAIFLLSSSFDDGTFPFLFPLSFSSFSNLRAPKSVSIRLFFPRDLRILLYPRPCLDEESITGEIEECFPR